MDKTKILYVNQEVYPYVRESKEATVGRYLPQGIQESGYEIRMFTPRYGCINERRNQLHEVYRLSGINIPINEVDHPLRIKVSSIQAARMQIYFIDNEEFFHKKNMLFDKAGKLYGDTDEKLIFFARGVLEAIKKLSWIPDVVHCSGWFSSLIPLYVRKAYRDHPAFANTKIITTLFSEKGFEGPIGGDLIGKMKTDKINIKEIASSYTDFSHDQLIKLAIDFSDGVILTDKVSNIESGLIKHAKKLEKPIVNFAGEDKFVSSCAKFYEKIISDGK